MSTLTGQYISQSYGGLIQLSTSTGIVTGSHTQLQDGLGTNLGVWLNGQGAISASAITASGDSRFNNVRVGNGPGNQGTNTVVGEDAFISNVSTIGNTAIGYGTLTFTTTGGRNTALGWSALTSNTTGEYNTSLGAQSMLLNVTGSNNTAVGYEALRASTGNDNTAFGYGAAYNITTGTDNTMIGYNAGRGVTTGNNNTIIGANVTGLSASLSNNIILADGAGSVRLRYSGSWTYSGSIAGEVRALSISSQTASVDLSAANLFTLTLVSGSTTHINPTNIRTGQTSMIRITQPAGGGGSVSFNSSVKFPSGLAYTASIGSSVVDTLSFVSFDGSTLQAVASYNFV